MAARSRRRIEIVVGWEANNDTSNSFEFGDPPAAELGALLAGEQVRPGAQRDSGSLVTPATLWSRPGVGITQRWNTGRNPGRTGWYQEDACLWDQAELAGPGHGFGAVGRAQLVEDVAGVLLHRLQRDHQLPGDLPVRPARSQQPQHLELPVGQGLDSAGRAGGGALRLSRTAGGGPERPDDPVQVLPHRAGACRNAAPLPCADEAAQERGHRRALVGEDADVALRPSQ